MKTMNTLAIITAIIAALTGAGAGISASNREEAVNMNSTSAIVSEDTTTQSGTSAWSNSGTRSSQISQNGWGGGMNGASSGNSSASAAVAAGTSALLDTSDLFSNRDLRQEADLSEAQYITVESNKTITITEAGVYVISGSAQNCTIRIEADNDNDKVQLVLDGVTITNTSTPAIYVVSADKTFITTASGTTNTLSVTGEFTADGDTNTNAVIFSKDDLVFNGLGTLKISSTDHAINGKDDVKFTGGTYEITATGHAIKANDSILICGGSFTLNAKDGLHCENDDDDTEGYIYISDGEFNIKGRSDGIQGNVFVQIDGGSFTISAPEGIEGTYVQINGGSINITSTDDGINASAKSSAYSPTVEINGGELTISMGQGDTDAIDANGSIYVNGGTINITAPTSSFDYDGTAQYTGGTIIINGQQVDSIPQSMMGGMGGFGGQQGGFGGQQGGFGGQQGGFGGQQGGFGGRR